MELSGIPPGLFPAVCYEVVSIRIRPGDSVLFCTDGLPDAFRGNGEQFGMDWIREICGADRGAPPVELLGKVFAEVQSFARGRAQHDDMAAAVFHLTT